MAGMTLSMMDKLIKEFYLGPVQAQFNNVNKSMRAWWRTFSNDAYYAEVVRNEMDEGLYDPILETIAKMVLDNVEEQQEKRRVRPNYKHTGAAVRIHAPRMHGKSKAGAFLKALHEEMAAIRADLKRDLARSIFMHPDDARQIVEECHPQGLWLPGNPADPLLSIYGIPVVVDSMVPPGSCYLLDMGTFRPYHAP